MDSANLEIAEVRLLFSGGEMSAQRAERISRGTMERLQEVAETALQQVDRDVLMERLEVPPMMTSFDGMNDEEISRAGAEHILRAFLAAI
jgi:hypothetical protein